jgi:hypothetical protein
MNAHRGEVTSSRLEVQRTNPELPNVVQTLRTPGSFADLLDCWEQHPDQDADDRDHDEKLDQGKT